MAQNVIKKDLYKLTAEDLKGFDVVIDDTVEPAVIRQENCLHCGNCMTVCPYNAIIREG